MAEIDGDHIAAVSESGKGMVVLREFIIVVVYCEIRPVRAKAPTADLHHPHELHVLVPEIDRIHILVRYAAAQHHDFFKFRQIGKHGLDLRRVLHGERDIRKIDLLGGGRESHAEELRFPFGKKIWVRCRKITQHVFGKTAVRELDALRVKKKR